MDMTSKERTKQIFSLAYNAGQKFTATTRSAFSRFKAEKEKARSRAAAFKDEESEYKRLIENASAAARAELKEADAEFSSTLKTHVIPALKEALAARITARPAPEFLDTLRVYREFDLPISRYELDGLLTASQGNYTALRALQTVAKENGYNVKFPDLADFQKDIDLMERLARTPSCFVPLDFSTERDDIYPEAPYFRPDGSVAYYSKNDSVRSLLTATEYQNAWGKIQAAGETWSATTVPAIEEYRPTKDEETGEEISPEQQRAADIAQAAAVVTPDNDPALLGRAIGQRRAAAEKDASRIADYYAGRPGGGSQ